MHGVHRGKQERLLPSACAIERSSEAVNLGPLHRFKATVQVQIVPGKNGKAPNEREMTPHQIAQEPKLHTCGNSAITMRRSDSGTFCGHNRLFWRSRIEISGLRPHILWLRRRGRKPSVYVTKPFVNQNKKVRSDCRTSRSQQC